MSPAQSPTPAHVPGRAHRSPGAAWLSRAVAPVIAVIAILASLLGVAPHAQAADSFVYWGYWQQTNGSWVYSQVGAATANPADGTVEGWRWMIDEGGAKPRPPRLTATFAQLCGSTPAEAGKKRVGLVVDFGRDVDGDGKTSPPAPVTACVVVPTTATGADLLARAGGVRAEKGMVCAVGGYPASGCSVTLATLTDAQKAADTPLAMPTPTATPSSTPTATAVAPATTAGTTAPAPASSSSLSPTIWVVLFLAAAVLAFAWVRRRRPVGS
ncbi:MAG TPA: SCO2322 family protein [Dermatophilaceae bacterium]|nr:hypothetical protein [Candidatus Phosphoribacter baldrii]HRC11998.1 SCO2322 family protein [Dermatophilaceae bacterium]